MGLSVRLWNLVLVNELILGFRNNFGITRPIQMQMQYFKTTRELLSSVCYSLCFFVVWLTVRSFANVCKHHI